MSHLSAEQIANQAYQAGFRGQDLTTAVAVAMAESSGDPRSHNGVPPDNSYGLWQINMLGSLGPARRKEFGIKSNDELFNPDTNAKAAHDVYKDASGSFSPWSTYTNGAYKKYLDSARKAAHHATSTHGGKHHGTDHKGGDKHGDKHHGHDKDHHKGAKKGDYSVDTAMLGDYANQTKTIGHALTDTDAKHLATIGTISEHSFGKLGKESGFTDALRGYGDSMHDQVGGISKNVHGMVRSVDKIGASYDQDDTQLGSELLKLLGT